MGKIPTLELARRVMSITKPRKIESYKKENGEFFSDFEKEERKVHITYKDLRYILKNEFYVNHKMRNFLQKVLDEFIEKIAPLETIPGYFTNLEAMAPEAYKQVLKLESFGF